MHRAAKPVEDYVTQAILYRLQRADAADVFELPADDATTKLREQLQQAQARYDRLPNLWSDGVITEEDLRAQRGKLKTQIAELRWQLPATSGHRSRALRAVATADDVEAAWAQTPIEAQRDIIGALAMITLYPAGPGVSIIKPGQVIIEWRKHDG